jgi:hypothetical protein
MDPWWTQQQAGWIGGLAGGGIGLLGGLVGALGGIFAPRGRLRGLVFSLIYFSLGVGGVGLAVGLAAVVLKQPFWVFYVPLLIGIVSVGSFGATLLVLRQRYREAELRRLAAEEFRRSG